MKQTFTSRVSHELRTPLTSIIGYLDLLREGKGGELTGRQGQWLSKVIVVPQLPPSTRPRRRHPLRRPRGRRPRSLERESVDFRRPRGSAAVESARLRPRRESTSRSSTEQGRRPARRRPAPPHADARQSGLQRAQVHSAEGGTVRVRGRRRATGVHRVEWATPASGSRAEVLGSSSSGSSARPRQPTVAGHRPGPLDRQGDRGGARWLDRGPRARGVGTTFAFALPVRVSPPRRGARTGG